MVSNLRSDLVTMTSQLVTDKQSSCSIKYVVNHSCLNKSFLCSSPEIAVHEIILCIMYLHQARHWSVSVSILI